MTWSQEISQLITDVDQLTSAANVKKSELDASVASTETDKIGAEASIVSATASFASAGANSTQAEAHKNAALAIYGTNAAQQTAVASVQASAALASGHAASASAALQQDLSGIATTLHRSPNTINSTFIYDTSKDSDGGAWTEKCQNTSWYNEPIMGKWLGPQLSEFNARYEGATLGVELITNNEFNNGITGWTTTNSSLATVSGGITTFNGFNTIYSSLVSSGFAAIVGKVYRVRIRAKKVSGNSTMIAIGSGANFAGSAIYGSEVAITNDFVEYTLFATATATTMYAGIFLNSNPATGIVQVDSVSVREVTALNTQSGDYFQLTTDGKFYRLWKNLYPNTQSLNSTDWRGVSNSFTTGVTDPSGGTAASLVSIITGTTVGFDDFSKRYGQDEKILQTFSIYIKAPATNAATSVAISIPNGGGVFNLSTGALISGVGITETLGNGWYRISTNSNKDNRYWFWGVTVTGSVGQGAILAFPQLEYGAVATTYEAKGFNVGGSSEVFRGNKRDFPRLAGIVAEATSVSIYDLTEPGRPMWMRFASSGARTGIIGWTNSGSTMTSLAALNAQLMLGNSASGSLVNFASDSYNPVISSAFQINGISRLSERNNVITYTGASGVTNPQTIIISSQNINAVAMTVLPDAPTDPVTGLRVPTIALGTNSGASIIKHNGTVVNSATTYFQSITLSPNVLTGSRGFSNADHFIAFNPGSLAAGFTFISSYGDQFDNLGATSRMTSRSRSQFFKSNSNRIGLRWLNESMGTVGKHLSSIITPTYNTGWMHGDIRRAYLSDIITESTSADNLANNLVSYTIPGTHTGISSAPVVGKTYEIRLTFSNAGGSVVVELGGYSSGWVNISAGERIFRVTATATTALYVRGDGNTSGTFSNVSVREVVTDRSNRAQAASINGTLTRSQLASGTSLVGYSGWSPANYLSEPYSTDLNFGTGEFNTSAWLNIPATLPLDTYPVIGSAVTVTGWTNLNSSWDTFSTTGNSFTASKTIAGGLDTAASTNTIPVILGNWYRVIITVSAVTVDAYSVTLLSGTNSRSTQGGASGTGTKVVYINANVASGNFTVGINASTIGSITVDSVSIQEIGPVLVFDRNHTSGPRICMGINGGGNIRAEAFDGTTTRTVTTTAAYNTAQWLKAEANYTTDGSLAIQVNGREVAVTRGNPLLTLNNTSATLTIGNSFALDAPFSGSIALLKLGATVPTAEQSTFMYEQEKQLFRANATSVLPDTSSIVGISYDDVTDRWSTVSAANESYWNGLVRTSVAPVPAGSYSRITTTSGIELAARITTNPGVDVTIPAYVLREELVKRSETANKLNRQTAIYDYIGGFTGNITTGSTAIVSVTNLTYPVSPVGARISGTGIPANTTITAVSGTTIYISAAATATTTGLVISFLDFNLPLGFETESVTSAGVVKQEGATKDYTRLFDGFLETIRFAVAPGATTWVRIQASKSIQ